MYCPAVQQTTGMEYIIMVASSAMRQLERLATPLPSSPRRIDQALACVNFTVRVRTLSRLLPSAAV